MSSEVKKWGTPKSAPKKRADTIDHILARARQHTKYDEVLAGLYRELDGVK